MTNPIFTYPHAGRDAAITGGFVYRGNQFPSEYVGTYFYGDYVRNYIRRLTMDGNGNVTGNVNFEPANGTEDGPYGEIVDIKQGPDGALYYVDIGISWQGPVNPAPSGASATRRPTSRPTWSPTPRRRPARHRSASRSRALGRATLRAGRSRTRGRSAMARPRRCPTPPTSTAQSGTTPLGSPCPTAPTRPSPPRSRSPPGTDPRPRSRRPPPAPPSGRATPSRSAAVPPTSKTARSRAHTWTVLFLHESHTHPGFPAVSGVTSGSFTIPTSATTSAVTPPIRSCSPSPTATACRTAAAGHHRPRKGESDLHLVTIGPHRDHRRDPRTTPYVHDSLVNFTHTIAAPDQSAGGSSLHLRQLVRWRAQSHTMTVPATNRTYAATFNASAPAQLLAAFGLNEGSGATSQGHFGQRQQPHFDQHHVDDGWPVVEWPVVQRHELAARTASTLDLGAQFTIEGWILNPTNSVTRRSPPWAAPATSTSATARSPLEWDVRCHVRRPLPVNTWTHVALTSDGVALRAYVNGVQQGATEQPACRCLGSGAAGCVDHGDVQLGLLQRDDR